jgi:uncharacterized membrane protein
MPTGGGNQPAEAGAAITYGWNKFKENWGEIIVALIVGFVIIVVLAAIGFFVQRSLTDTGSCTVKFTDNGITRTGGCESPSFFVQLLAAGLFQFLVWIGQAALQLFIIRATLMLIRGERLDASRIMTTENLGGYIVGAIIVGILTFVGFILCIVPGILVIFFTFFWGYFLVDKNMAPMDAITASYNLVKDNVGQVVVFVLLSWVVMFVGVIACGVGIIVAWPVVIIATGYMYKRLQGEPVAA